MPDLPTSGELCDRQALETLLAAGAARLGQPLDAASQRLLLDLVAHLLHWNRAYNLTAVREPREAVVRHLLDSLAVRPFLRGETLLDVGTGAGFPGLPLAICEPRRRIALLDSNGKKLRFVRHVAATLGLNRVEIVQSRFEAFQPGRKFSTIVCRALRADAGFIAAAQALLERPGSLLLMQGRCPDQASLAGFAHWPGQCLVHPLQIPFLAAPRHLIELRND